ncbi:hypothetical protein PVK06_028861 [Gossypium arboreum]|uniref:Uncharacterized protein n=1 Tax=Gossypium arboreum TaxID=29729 RepID=A0ABR0P526_GOSAR|nr:hypothetical protein PVK06_028861 [Gossypium arboreum]
MGLALADPTHIAMDHDLEDETLIGEEGKKRSRGEIDELPEQDDTNKMERVRWSYGYTNGIGIGLEGTRGGLCLAWQNDTNITLQNFSGRHIDVIVEEKEIDVKWRLIGFYGSPYAQDREDSLDVLKNLYNDEDIP